MANKIISEKDLHDDFLSAMIRSEEPLLTPQGFSDEIMNRIGLIAQPSIIKPYKPPIWLKWGIPGVFVSCLIGLLFSGSAVEPTPVEPVSALFEKTSKGVSSWFSGFNFNFDFQFPALDISSTTISIIAGGIVLMWGFLLLSRFLEKRAGRDR